MSNKKITSLLEVRRTKKNLTTVIWKQTWVGLQPSEICQLFASLSGILPQLNLEFDSMRKKERYKHRRKFVCITRVRLFSSSTQVCF